MSFLIHRIRLENVRGIGEVEVDLQANGVTVIQAPNETGKSTLFDSVKILRDYKSSSSAGPVKGLQPIGKDVGSLIQAELSIGPYRLTYTKRFNREKMTELHIHTPQAEQLTGDDAHNRVDELLATYVDTVLLNSLWIEQGEGLNAITLDRSSAIAAALSVDPQSGDSTEDNGGTGIASAHDDARTDEGVGIDSGGGTRDADESLLERVEQEFLQYFTQTGKDGKALKQIEQDVAEASHVVNDVQRKVSEIESYSNQQVQVTNDIKRAESSLTSISVNADELALQMTQITERRDQHKQLSRDLDMENERLDMIQSKVNQRADWLEQLTELTNKHTAIHTKLTNQTQRCDELKTTLGALKAQRSDLSDMLSAARKEREQAERAAHVITMQRELAAAVSRVSSLKATDQRKSAAQAVIDANPVTNAQIKAIQQAQQQVSIAEAQLKMAAPSVHLVALADVAIAVNGVERNLAAGSTEDHDAGEPLNIELAGILDLEIRPGSSLDELQSALETARSDHDEALRIAGVESLAAAESSLERKQAAESEVNAAQQAIDALLEGDSRDELHEHVLQLEAALRNAGIPDGDSTAQGPGTDASIVDHGPVTDEPIVDGSTIVDESMVQERLETARVKETEANDAVLEIQTKLDVAQVESATEQGVLSGLVSDQAVLTSQLDQITASLDQARVESTDEQLTNTLVQQTDRRDGQQAELVKIAEQLTALNAESIEALHENAGKKLADAESRLKALRDSLLEVNAKLDALGGTGLAEELAAAEVDLAHQQQTERHMKRRAGAVRLLKEHLEEARAEVFDAYRAPLRNRINALGKVVFDQSFDVEIDDAFTVTRRTLGGGTLDWAALSSGAQEQLSVLTAVAAAQLASDGGVPLILDDTLGYSDPDRMDRVGAVLSRVTDAQVIVLTCVPSRFETIGGAHRVDLRPTPG